MCDGYVMHDGSQGESHVIPGVSTVGFNWAAFRTACRQRGAVTVPDCATLTGVPVRTLYEMRRRPASANIGRALQIRAATELGLDELFPVERGKDLAAGIRSLDQAA